MAWRLEMVLGFILGSMFMIFLIVYLFMTLIF